MSAKRPPLSLKGRALALLAQREQSASELRRKLLRYAKTLGTASALVSGSASASASARNERVDSDPDANSDGGGDDSAQRVDEVIDWLRAHNYLSEERFAESRIHARAGRYGNLRIRQELAQHGVALSAEASQSLKDSELARANEVWCRKFSGPPADAVDRARHARFLAQRGFSPDVISRVLRAAGYAANREDADN